MSESQHTPGPWAWQRLGELCLVGQHGRRPIVLTTLQRNAQLCVRDERGVLKPLDPDHPDARLIAAAPDLLEAARAAVAAMRPDCVPLDEYEAAVAQLDRVIAKAQGGAL